MADASDLRRSLARQAQRAVVLAAVDVKTALRRAAPYKTGATQDSVDVVGFRSTPEQARCTAEATTPQATFTEEGTQPHVIRARRAKALRFRYQGRIVFARSVNHPGNIARPWFRPTVRREWSGALARAFGRLA